MATPRYGQRTRVPPRRVSAGHGREESGTALVLTLVFLSTIGILASALISYEFALTKGSFATRRTQARESGVNSGVDWAVASLRAGRDVFCHGTGERQVLSISGRQVEVRCTVHPDDALTGNGIALYLNRFGASDRNTILTKGEVSPSKEDRIVGPVYNGAGKAGWQLGSPLFVDGDVVQDDGDGECSAKSVTAAPGNLESLYPTVKQCAIKLTTVTPAEVPDPCAGVKECTDPAPVLLDAFGEVTKEVPACKVWSPGTYTKAPALAANNYFQPGVYAFVLDGEWKIGAALRGGDPAEGTVRDEQDPAMSSAPRCEGAPKPTSPNGVVFVLGGNTSIRVLDTARVELFAYNDGKSRLPSLVVGGWSDVTGWTKPSSVPVERELLTVGPTSPEFILHGGVFAPQSSVRFVGGGDVVATIRNTVVVAGFGLVAAKTPKGPFGIEARTGTSTKYVVTARSCPGSTGDISHEACTEPPAGPVEPELCASATVTVYDDDKRTVYVDNWRIDRDPTSADPATCDQDPA